MKPELLTRFGSVTTSFAGSVDQRFFAALEEKIDAEEQILNAGAIDTIEKYKLHAGRRAAFVEAKALMEQAIQDAMRS